MESGKNIQQNLTDVNLMEQVGRMVASINRCRDTRQLLENIHAILAESFYVDNFYVVMLQENGQLNFPYFVDSIDSFSEQSLNSMSLEDIQSSLTYFALTSNVISNFTKRTILDLQEQDIVRVKGTIPEQWLGFPLELDDNTLGAFIVQSYRDENEYDVNHVELFAAIAHVVSAALKAYKSQSELALANTELSQHKTQLEQLIHARTASLASEKQKLELEINQRTRLQLELEDKVSLLEEQNRRNQELQSQLRHQASHDHLTGLANRHELSNVLIRIAAKMERESGVVYLLFIDLDGFKLVNDNNGHEVGDKLLVEVSKRLMSLVRGYDLIARIGGDEFVVLIQEPGTPEIIDKIAQRIVSKVSEPMTIDGKDVKVGASVGIASSNESAEVPNLILKADKAMYLAKRKGKGQSAWYG